MFNFGNIDMSFSVIIGVDAVYRKNAGATVSCVVLDSDIATGNALVFNLETERIHVVTPEKRRYVMEPVREIVSNYPEHTKNFYRKKIKKELERRYVSL